MSVSSRIMNKIKDSSVDKKDVFKLDYTTIYKLNKYSLEKTKELKDKKVKNIGRISLPSVKTVTDKKIIKGVEKVYFSDNTSLTIQELVDSLALTCQMYHLCGVSKRLNAKIKPIVITNLSKIKDSKVFR